MHSPAVVSMNQTSVYIDTKWIISSVAIETRTSILLLSLSEKSSLRPVKSSSICWGHSSQIFVNSLLGYPFEEANRPPPL